MRRLIALALGLAALGVLGAVGTFALPGPATGSSAPSSYRIDAIFDNAHGLIPGQLVKVAGARVGTIEDVTLTPDYKARVQMRIDGRFAPFRSDAACTIRPEGLLAENYVNCDPGSPAGQPLQPSGGHAATVPVSQTTEPVNLTDLFNIWNVPTRERLTVLLDELGIGTAARGEDINAILRRANPALALARQVIAILRRQRASLAATIDNSDRVLAAVAARSGRVQDFIGRAAHVTGQIAAHRGPLANAIAKLPPLLDQTRPALRKLDVVARTGTPLLTELRRSAPSLNQLQSDLGPFARAARPALASIGRTLAQGTRTARESGPQLHALRTYAEQSLPNAQLAGRLFVNLRDRGFVEELLNFFYNGAAAGARFDSVSHILPSHVSFECSSYATTPTPGCSARFTAAHGPRATRQQASRPAGGTAPTVGPPARSRPGAPASTPSAPGGPPGPAGLPTPPISVPRLPQLVPTPPLPPPPAPPSVPKAPVKLPRVSAPPQGASQRDRGLRSLLGYFLG